MGFYDLSKEERAAKVADVQYALEQESASEKLTTMLAFFSDDDLYIRKVAYTAVGRIYNTRPSLRAPLLEKLTRLKTHEDELVRQTVVNAAGEIGMFQFEQVQSFFEEALFDDHHKVRNAVIGSVKKMGKRNPVPVLNWAKKYLTHENPEVRREICHGIELRGRTHPQDVLPLLEVLQHDDKKRVRDTLVHVIGQISYKKNCLPKVIEALGNWKNKELVSDAVDEIVDVHSMKRYGKFTALTQQQAINYIDKHLDPAS